MPVEIRDGRLSGPGVYDMKAGLVQGIFALRALRDLGLAPEVEPAFFINSDEEIGSPESLPRIERAGAPGAAGLRAGALARARGRPQDPAQGSLRFTIRVFGKAAHSGLDPEKGASAIRELARVIQWLYTLADPERGITVNVGVIAGGLRANVVAPEARAELDIRVLARGGRRAASSARCSASAASTPGTRIEVLGGDRPAAARADARQPRPLRGGAAAGRRSWESPSARGRPAAPRTAA